MADTKLARLRGIKQYDVAAIQADGRRWITISLHWIDGSEPTAVTLDPEDAVALGDALFRTAIDASASDAADQN